MWSKWINRQGVDLTTIEYIDLAFFELISKFTKDKGEHFFTTLENGEFNHYTNIDIDGMGKFYFKKYYSKPEQIKNCYRQGLRRIKVNDATVKAWQKKLVKISSNVLLNDALRDFERIFRQFNYEYSILPFVSIEAWQKGFEKVVLPSIPEKQKQLILNSINKPWKKTFLSLIKDSKASGKEKLKRSEFLRSWSIVWYQPISKDWIDNLKTKPQVHQKLLSQKRLINILNPSKEQLAYIAICPYIAFYKDWRDELRRKQIYSWSFLFDQIAAELGISKSGLGYLTLKEISQSLSSGKIDHKLIKNRSRKLVLITTKNNSVASIVIDNNTKKYLKIIKNIGEATDVKTVKGLPVYEGLVRGRVRLIANGESLEKIQKGEILVSNTTHPSYLFAMKKSAAIVTNEGGIVCHAAITAREMKKPCIVGTKIATKVFKDGDLVEVDANKGTVRKL